MRPLAALCLGLVLASSLKAADPADPSRIVAADDARIAVMGRTALANGRLRMGFPGVTLRFVYRGTAPILRMTGDSPDCYFNLACNGWDPVVIRLKAGPNAIALPTGVAPREGWLIELVRRTESWMGTASFDGLVLPAGCEILAPPAWPERKLMFIGDSFTCGEYDERFPPEDDRSPRTTNVARSYGMLLARWLGAQVQVIGYGGRGITRDWSGKTDVNTVPVFFPRALPDDPTSVWDPSRYVPDVVVINDGTDFDAGPPDESRLAEAFAAFVAQVRAAYPQAYILLSESAFQSDGSDGRPRTSRDALLRILRAIAQRHRESGDARVDVVLTGFHPGTPSDGHPVAFQHEQAALDFLAPIRKAAGW